MLTIDIYNTQFNNIFAVLATKMSDLTPALEQVGAVLENNARARFESQSDPAGHPWAAWKPSTVKSYPEDGKRRILDRYGDMLDSLSYQVQPDNNSVVVGFGQPYAVYHEFGAKHMDRRGLLTTDPNSAVLSDSDNNAVMDVLRKFLDFA